MRTYTDLLILDYAHIVYIHLLLLYAHYTYFIDYAQVNNPPYILLLDFAILLHVRTIYT